VRVCVCVCACVCECVRVCVCVLEKERDSGCHRIKKIRKNGEEMSKEEKDL
jgi:hypothetical protein